MSKIELTKDLHVWKIRISGALDERTKFPPIADSLPLHIDLGAVEHINSVGVRTWCLWLKEQSARPQIVLENCPFVVTKYFSAVRETMTPNVRVESFYIPFFNEKERMDVLFRRADESVAGVNQFFPVILDPEGREMEMEAVPETYFRFLKRTVTP